MTSREQRYLKGGRSPHPLCVAIASGGIGGMALALALHDVGCRRGSWPCGHRWGSDRAAPTAASPNASYAHGVSNPGGMSSPGMRSTTIEAVDVRGVYFPPADNSIGPRIG
jgi:hypothetical protein